MDTEEQHANNTGTEMNELSSMGAEMQSHEDEAMDIADDADAHNQADSQDDEEEEIMEDDLSILMRGWVNERNAPDILEYEGTTIENLMELVDFQNQRIKSQPTLIANILKMDVDRVKYLIRSYLRARLYKIEQHAKYYIDDSMYKSRLSQNELDYAKGFVAIEEKHMRRSFMDQLPPHLRSLSESNVNGLDMVSKPDMEEAVFCRVRSNVGEFQFDASEDPIVMRRNNIFITRYSIIRNLLEDGKVELI